MSKKAKKINMLKEIGMQGFLKGTLDSFEGKLNANHEVVEATAKWGAVIIKAVLMQVAKEANEELPPSVVDYLNSQQFLEDILDDLK